MFLKHRGIEIDSSGFEITFNPPMNFSSYRELALESERAQLFNQVAAIPYLSNQFKLQKYLGLTELEMKQNEELWRKENDYKKFTDDKTNADLRNVGIRPEPDLAVNPGAEIPFDQVPPPAEGEEGINTDIPTTPGAGGTPEI